MLLRFSLYGFLKNQTYHDAFFVLALREKGLTFFQIGLLFGSREILSAILGVPAGLFADKNGKRNVLLLSFVAYIPAYLLLASSRRFPVLCLAMICMACGEAFRSAPHKALVFDWLRSQGRTGERIHVYAGIRAWFKAGSAVSVLIGMTLALLLKSYSSIFYFSLLPVLLSIVNCAAYPPDSGSNQEIGAPAGLGRFALGGFRSILGNRPLSKILLDSVAFESASDGAFHFVQPILAQAVAASACLALAASWRMSTAAIGTAYFCFHIAAIFLSRLSGPLNARMGGEERSVRRLLVFSFALFSASLACLYCKQAVFGAVCLIANALLQNLWRPPLLGRIDHHCGAQFGATVLSVEAFMKSAFGFILSPLLGFTVDHAGFWSLGAFGMLITGWRACSGHHFRYAQGVGGRRPEG